jgi:hypothetical protein
MPAPPVLAELCQAHRGYRLDDGQQFVLGQPVHVVHGQARAARLLLAAAAPISRRVEAAALLARARRDDCGLAAHLAEPPGVSVDHVGEANLGSAARLDEGPALTAVQLLTRQVQVGQAILPGGQ